MPDSRRVRQAMGRASKPAGPRWRTPGEPAGLTEAGSVLGTCRSSPTRYAALDSAPMPPSIHHGSAIPSSAAAVVWLITAPGTMCSCRTLAIEPRVAGAAVGVWNPRNTVTSSGPARRLDETPSCRHSARGSSARSGRGVGRMLRDRSSGRRAPDRPASSRPHRSARRHRPGAGPVSRFDALRTGVARWIGRHRGKPRAGCRASSRAPGLEQGAGP